MPLKVMRHAYNSFLSLQSDIFRSVLCLEVFLPKFKDIQIMMMKNKNVNNPHILGAGINMFLLVKSTTNFMHWKHVERHTSKHQGVLL